MSYIGNEPIVSATRTVTEITATAGQTVFTANGGYTVGFIDVFVNGSQLTASDFTATDGSTITLTEAATVNDIVRLVAWGTFQAANITSGSLSAGGITWSQAGGVTLPRIDSSNEGGQLNFNRASDNTATWSIDSFGNTSTPALRFIDGVNVRMAIDGSGNVGIGTSSPTSRLTVRTSDGDGVSIQNAAGTAYRWAVNADNSFSCVNTGVAERGRFTSGGDFQFNSGYGSVATAFGCRAWVNFNGTGTVAIRASGNVSSITDNGTGDYNVNFATSMPDANYSTVSMADSGGEDSYSKATPMFYNSSSQASNTVRVRMENRYSLYDLPLICVSVFR